jgi:hypothetical protein
MNAVTRTADGALLLSFGRILAADELDRRRRRAAIETLAARTRLTRPAQTMERALSARRRRGAHSTTTEHPIADSNTALVSISDAEPRPAGVHLLRPATGGVPAHNALELGDTFVVNDSGGGTTVVYDRFSEQERVRIPIPGDPAWPRGLALLPDGKLLVGGQRPAALHVVDTDSGAVLSTCELDGEHNETVYAVTVLPDVFEDPPDVLESLGDVRGAVLAV